MNRKLIKTTDKFILTTHQSFRIFDFLPKLKKNLIKKGGQIMPDSIYKVIELIGTSETSWEEAAKKAVERAAQTLEDLRVAEVSEMDLKIEDGKVVAYRTKVKLSFRFRES